MQRADGKGKNCCAIHTISSDLFDIILEMKIVEKFGLVLGFIVYFGYILKIEKGTLQES